MAKPTEYPLRWPEGWPRAASRKPGHFTKDGYKVTFAGAEKRVRDQLGAMFKTRMEMHHLIVSSNVIRDREPTDPGVAVYFQNKSDSPMRVIAIDRYSRAADNLAAIAATLEAMRAIERHGGARIMERAFTGFEALPAPSPWKKLGLGEGASAAAIEAAFKSLAKDHHPDRGGNSDRFAEISAARDECLKRIGAA